MANTTYIDIAESSKNRNTVVGAEFVGKTYTNQKNASTTTAAEIAALNTKISTLNESFISLFNKYFAFDSTEIYSKDDVVSKEGKLYKAKADSTTGAWDADKWTDATVSEALTYALAN